MEKCSKLLCCCPLEFVELNWTTFLHITRTGAFKSIDRRNAHLKECCSLFDLCRHSIFQCSLNSRDHCASSLSCLFLSPSTRCCCGCYFSFKFFYLFPRFISCAFNTEKSKLDKCISRSQNEEGNFQCHLECPFFETFFSWSAFECHVYQESVHIQMSINSLRGHRCSVINWPKYLSPHQNLNGRRISETNNEATSWLIK